MTSLIKVRIHLINNGSYLKSEEFSHGHSERLAPKAKKPRNAT